MKCTDRRHHVGWNFVPLCLSLAFLIGWGTGASAATLHVANNGVDSSTCGTATHPCRSINYTIGRASVGDQTIVGPGHYANPDETSPSGCGCLVLVDKLLTITSRDGSSITVLDAGGQTVEAVKIIADGVTFGK